MSVYIIIEVIWKCLTFQGSDGGDSEYESADEEELGDEEEEDDDELILMPDGLGVPGEVRPKEKTVMFCALRRSYIDNDFI